MYHKKLNKIHQPVLPESSPENALPYDVDPVCETAPRATVPRAFCNCRILNMSLGSGWLWTVAVSSSSCPTSDNTSFLIKQSTMSQTTKIWTHANQVYRYTYPLKLSGVYRLRSMFKH